MGSELLKSISLDVTYKCNFRCRHCFNSSGEHDIPREEMSDEKIIDVAKQIADLQVDTLCFCGGEPLLRVDTICKAAQEIRKSNNSLSVNMVSNGYLMTSDIAKKLKDVGMSFIQISLDGATKEGYEWLRCKEGAFERALNAITCLVNVGFQVGVAFTPTKKNISEIDDTIKLCSELGVNSFRVQPIMELGRAKNIKNVYLDSKDYFVLKNQLRSHGKYAINTEWGDPVLHITAARNRKRESDFFTINAYGDLGVSPYLPVAMGNINRHSLQEYLDGGLLNAWRDFDFLEVLTDGIVSAEKMDVSENNHNAPSIFTGKDFTLDILDDKDIKAIDAKFVKMINEA